MPRPLRWLVLSLLGLFALAGSPSSRADEAENLRQLQAMPLERRVALSENLERFDKLGSVERDAVRKLDAEIARKDQVEQERYRALLRRYHLWVNGLTSDQQEQLRAADGTEARLNLARKFRQQELQDGATGPKVFGIRTGDLGLLGPFEAAHLLKIWAKLTPARRLELTRNHPKRAALFREVWAIGRTLNVTFDPMPADEERRLDGILDANEAFKNQLGAAWSRRIDMAGKKADVAAKAAPHPKKFEMPYAEFLYFEDHKPKPVLQPNLERFSKSCPLWIHAMLDPLSPDDARAYLMTVYRLLYPEPGEMPIEPKSSKAPASSSPEPAKKPGA